MLFAAGMGTRLKPLTDVIPKALVPVGDKPLVQHVMEKLVAAGCRDVVVNVHHKAGQIKNFLQLLAPALGASVQVSDESEQLLETGGGIRKASKLFRTDEPVLIHNVDILSNVDLHQLYNKVGTADALLLVSERKTKRYLVFDDDMRLIGWKNIETGEVKGNGDGHLYAFSGIHVIGQQLIADMEEWPDRFPIIDFYLSECVKRNIKGYLKTDLHLLDVGKLDTLASADEFLG